MTQSGAEVSREGSRKPLLSVVVPSLSGRADRARASLATQTVSDWELVVVTGVRPAARARNEGVARAAADLVLFLDDDTELGHERVLEQMLAAVEPPDVGVVGTSKSLPPDSNWLQRRIGIEVPRAVTPVLDESIDSNPPLDSYGYTLVATMCCLVRRECFERIGGFDEDLVTGEDPDFFYRVRRAGYRLRVPANCWVTHAPPATLRVLLQKSFMYGVGHAHESRLEPGRRMDVLPLDRWWAKAALVLAPLALVPSLFLSVELTPRLVIRPGLRPIQAVSRLATLYGYAWGYFTSRSGGAPGGHRSTPRSAS